VDIMPDDVVWCLVDLIEAEGREGHRVSPEELEAALRARHPTADVAAVLERLPEAFRQRAEGYRQHAEELRRSARDRRVRRGREREHGQAPRMLENRHHAPVETRSAKTNGTGYPSASDGQKVPSHHPRYNYNVDAIATCDIASSMAREYLTVAELAELFGLTPKTVRNRMHDGTWRRGEHWFHPPGLGPRFKWSAMRVWLESDRPVPETPGAAFGPDIPRARRGRRPHQTLT